MPGEAPGGDRGHVTPLPGTNAGPVIDRLWSRAPRGGGLVPSRPAPTGYRQWPTRRLGAMLGAVPGWFPFAALAAIWAGAVMYGAYRGRRSASSRFRGGKLRGPRMTAASPGVVRYKTRPGDAGPDPKEIRVEIWRVGTDYRANVFVNDVDWAGEFPAHTIAKQLQYAVPRKVALRVEKKVFDALHADRAAPKLGSLRGRRRKSDKMRDQARPEAVGYELDRETLTPTRRVIDTSALGDYGADPIGDGLFRMVPSGDIVDFEERNRRLKRPPLRGAFRGARRTRTAAGDSVHVDDRAPQDIKPGDIIRLANDSLQVQSVDDLGARVQIRARSWRDAGGFVTRKYLKTTTLPVEVAPEE